MPKWLDLPAHRGLYLLVSDVAGMYLCAAWAAWFRAGAAPFEFQPALLLMTAITVVTLYVMNVYHVSRQSNAIRLISRSITAVLISMAFIGTLIYSIRGATFVPVFWRSVLLLAMSLFALWAAGTRYLACQLLRRQPWRKYWLVLGEDHFSEDLLDELTRDGIELQFQSRQAEKQSGEIAMNHSLLDVAQFRAKYLGVVLDKTYQPDPKTTTWLMSVRLSGAKILSAADFFEQTFQRIPVQELADQWFVSSTGFDLLHKDIPLKIKRLIDVVIASSGLMLAVPIGIIVALLIKLWDRGPVFFGQLRMGAGGSVFRVYKFRTMIVNAEHAGPQWTKENDHRITPVGRFLRCSRLDEVPQLWNVL
ncbi:MAG TPA: hypothetical protein ENI62_03525, partial [Gammaproteobacteria bacterium]|nr:hypothetical protein [Gammaproteobacteria bacterium]